MAKNKKNPAAVSTEVLPPNSNEGLPPAAEPAPAEGTAPSAAMLALFAPDRNALPARVERLNMPRMYKPDEIPVGGIVSGEIVKILDSPVSTVKGKLLWIRHANGEEFTFPCTGVIRQALAPGVQDNEKELIAALNKHVGKQVFFRRTPDKLSGKWRKNMFTFDVFVAAK